MARARRLRHRDSPCAAAFVSIFLFVTFVMFIYFNFYAGPPNFRGPHDPMTQIWKDNKRDVGLLGHLIAKKANRTEMENAFLARSSEPLSKVFDERMNNMIMPYADYLMTDAKGEDNFEYLSSVLIPLLCLDRALFPRSRRRPPERHLSCLQPPLGPCVWAPPPLAPRSRHHGPQLRGRQRDADAPSQGGQWLQGAR